MVLRASLTVFLFLSFPFNALSEEKLDCHDEYQRTEDCCLHPQRCLSESELADQRQLDSLITRASASNNSIQTKAQEAKNNLEIQNLQRGLNQKTAARCKARVTLCQRACTAPKDQEYLDACAKSMRNIDMFKKQAEETPGSAGDKLDEIQRILEKSSADAD